MGYIDKKYDTTLSAYLTQRGREILLSGDRDGNIARYFILGDSDRNYQVVSHDTIREMMIPDVTGDKTDSLFSIAKNIDIRHKVGTYKEILNSQGFQRSMVYVPTPRLIGQNVKWVIASRVDDIYGDNESMFGNMYKTLNLPCTNDEIEEYKYGDLSKTALQFFNQERCLIYEIPKNTYGELIDGKTIKLSIELEGGEIIDIYSSFFENEQISNSGHNFYSDPNLFSENYGSTFKDYEAIPGQEDLITPIVSYNSNVAYMFSDYVKPPRGNSNNTWSSKGTYFNTEKAPSGKVADKWAAKYNGSDMDTPVGIAYLDKGFIVITHPDIVNNITTDVTVEGIEGTEIEGTSLYMLSQYYNDNSALDFSSFNTEFIQHAVCPCLFDEFYTTENPTYDENSGRPIAVTEIGLYNSSYELIAIAKPSFPIAKDRYSIINFNINIRV